MFNIDSNHLTLHNPLEGLWLRLIEKLDGALDKRRVQEELALMTERERIDLDVMRGNLQTHDFGLPERARHPIQTSA
jgi:hypothetical protein